MCSKLGQFEFNGPLFATMVKPIKEKLSKYFQEISPVITCAATLNPCFNVSGVELLIEKITLDLSLAQDDNLFANSANNHFNKCFKDLFVRYYTKYVY